MGSHARPDILDGRAGRLRSDWPSPEESAEDVFLVWLLGLPDEMEVADAARVEIARLDRAAPLRPGPRRLRALMVEAAEHRPGRRRRRGED